MKLSFVIPVYKTEQYLARCLDSLKAQTDGGFEAVVAKYDARFRYLRQDKNRSTFQAKVSCEFLIRKFPLRIFPKALLTESDDF